MSIEKAKKNFVPNYKPAPFVISHAKASWIIDTEGRKYLDYSSGIAVSNLGHCPPEVVQAIQSQAEKLIHSSNMYWNQPSMELAEELTSSSFADRVFFCNSGTEANEAALKLARKYFFDQKKARPKFLSFQNAFHGRTFGSLSATAKEKYREAFQPVVPGFECAEFNKLESVNAITEETAAVIIEPVQGEGGVFAANPEFLQAIRKRCHETGSLLIFDCIQVGMMRTGSLYGYEDTGVTPDILCLAKALGNGIPIGAMLTTDKIAQSFDVGSHGSTFGGNPIACAAALAVLRALRSSDFQSQFKDTHEYFWLQLREKIANLPLVKEVRGKGLMIGIELKEDLNPYFEKLRENSILVTRILPRTFRVLPPLNTTRDEIDFFIHGLKKSLENESQN